MIKYCFFMTNQNHWLSTAKQLYENKIAEPVLWLGDDKHYEEAKQIFGKNVQNMLQFVHRPFLFKDTDYNSQNIEFLESINYLRAKDICLKMMDRIDLNSSLGRLDREVYFNNIVIWTLKKIKENKPEVFIAVENPHSHAQYLIYEICQFLDIPVFKFNNFMPVPLLFLENIKTGNRVEHKLDIAHSNIDIQIEKEIKKFISDIIDKNENFELSYMKTQKKNRVLINRLINYCNKGFIQDLKDIKFNLSNQLSSTYSPTNPYGIGFIGRKLIKKKRIDNLRKQIKVHEEEININHPYVYFPLHYEPERTTNPDGKRFHDQFSALLELRNIIPNNINIIVKEHPSQILVADRASRGRSPLFYNLIKNVEGVKLAPIFYNSIQLMLKSKFVATITGSVALEASVLGIKTLTFGQTWYKGLPNTYSWKKNISYESIISQEIEGKEAIINFLMNLKNNFSVPAFQNHSQRNFFKRYETSEFENLQSRRLYNLLANFFKNKLYNNIS